MKRIIRKKFRKFWKSMINRRLVKYTSRFGLVVFLLAAVLSFGKIQGTNSAFTDTETSIGNTMTAGYWIPTLTMSYTPSSPNGDNGFWKTAPCATLSAKIGGADATLSDVDIYYKFSASGDPSDSDSKYTGACIPIPDGNPTQFQAIALNRDNHDWESNIVSGEFKVDTTAPVISALDNSDPQNTKGAANDDMALVDITWNTNENAISNVVYGTSSKADCSSYPLGAPTPADTSANNTGHSVRLENLAPGSTYYYRASSTDAAGNSTCSSEKNFSIPSASDSPASTDVVLNEFIAHSSDDTAHKPNGEWVELYNKSGSDVNVFGWYIYDSTNANGVQITALNTEPAGTTVPSHGYLVVYIQKQYFNNDGDTVKLYNGLYGTGTLIDSHVYTGTIAVDKSIARFPDGVGIWIDPEDTPGKKNELKPEEKAAFQAQAFEKCFNSDGSVKKSKEDICQPEFLVYLGMLGNKKDKTMTKEMKEKFLGNGMPSGENIETVNDVQISPADSANDPVVPESDPVIVLDDVSPSDQQPASDTNPPVDAPKIISKEFAISFKGKLDALDGFLADTEQKMKKIELSGEEKTIDSLKDFEIDLTKIKIDKAGKIEILVSDLDLPKDAELVGAKKDDVVVLITVTEKPKDDPKKDEVKKIDAAVPKADDPKTDDKKDDSKDNSGGSGGGSGDPAPKSVDSVTT